MSPDNEHPDVTGPFNISKMDVIDAALESLTLQLGELDKAGLSMASIHLNAAVERLRSEKVALENQLQL